MLKRNKKKIGLMLIVGFLLIIGDIEKRKWWMWNYIDCWKIIVKNIVKLNLGIIED